MTNRERILATCRQEEVDRFPVWMKMANDTWKNSQPEPYKSMSGVDLLKEAGCDVMLNNSVRVDCSRPDVTVGKKAKGNEIIYIFSTPDGELTSIDLFDENTKSTHPAKYPVENKEDMKKARWLFKNTTYAVDPQAARDSEERQKQFEKDDIITISGMGPSPFMHCIEHLCGPINTVYLQMDEPELFDELIEEMHQDQVRRLSACLPNCQADTFWMSENTSTSLISPDQFKQFCMPNLKKYGQMVLDNDIVPVHHMCGTLNALLELINELPAMVNEAYTTSPLGDVSLAEGKKRMPSKALIGGTNATLWMAHEDSIVQAVSEDLDNCENKRGIFLTSAGVLTSLSSMEKTKRVVQRLKDLPC